MKLARLMIVLGILAIVTLGNDETIFALSYCEDDCVAMEDRAWEDCPQGAGQSQDCAKKFDSVNHCWMFSSWQLCQPPHPDNCHWVPVTAPSTWGDVVYLCHW